MNARATIRTVAVLLLTFMTLAMSLPDVMLPWHPVSGFGYSANPRSGRVTSVDRDARARGLRAGDVIDGSRMNSERRKRYVAPLTLAPPGTVLELPLAGGRSVAVRSHTFPRSFADNATDLLLMAVLLTIALIAASLVLLRPAPATWAFFLYALHLSPTKASITGEYAPFFVIQATDVFGAALIVAGNAALFSFALRFPQAQPRGAARLCERCIMYGAVPALLAFILVREFAAGPQLGAPIGAFAWIVDIASAIVLLARYAGSAAEERNRLQWIVAAFAIAFIPPNIDSAYQIAGTFPPVWITNLADSFQVIAPIALAYTIFKHRLFDLRLIVSRAVLYAVLTSIMVALLALVDWGIGRWLAESRFELAAELLLAVGIGVLLTTAHRRIEQVLNSIIFRAQALALQALRRFAQETDLIADPHYLLLQTHEALRARLESDYAAIYTAEGSSYVLVTPACEPVRALLASHDLAVLRLRRWHEPFECEEPGHPLFGALLLPMTARGQLVGFIACGPKRDRTHYLPDEIETLTLLAHRTGSAYALLTLAAANPPAMPAPAPTL